MVRILQTKYSQISSRLIGPKKDTYFFSVFSSAYKVEIFCSFTCILPDYVIMMSPKNFEKDIHFENMRVGLLIQNSLL